MASFSFIDPAGVSWMILPCLPESHPDADAPGPLRGLTFYSAAGETRVLSLQSYRWPQPGTIAVSPLGTGSRVAARA